MNSGATRRSFLKSAVAATVAGAAAPLSLLILSLTAPLSLLAQHAPATPITPAWKARLAQELPVLGHRNWILIADSAYPMQVAPGVETIETNADQLDVVQTVLSQLNHSIHVRPLVSLDAELAYVPDSDAPGASVYRKRLAEVLKGLPVENVAHEQLLRAEAETGNQYHILVLKTRMTIPYTSVFIRLDCKYWPADAEKRMRERMATGTPEP